MAVGERVVGRGSDLYQLCKDIDDTIKGISNFYLVVFAFYTCEWTVVISVIFFHDINLIDVVSKGFCCAGACVIPTVQTRALVVYTYKYKLGKIWQYL